MFAAGCLGAGGRGVRREKFEETFDTVDMSPIAE